MGVGENDFTSKSREYETPNELFIPLQEEFDIKLDVCASATNHKCVKYITKEIDAFTVSWSEAFWMNPPFGKNLKKWVQRAYEQSLSNGVIGVTLLPVRSNTNWWHKYIIDTGAEVRFIRGEVKFVGQNRGLWLPLAIVIFKPSV